MRRGVVTRKESARFGERRRPRAGDMAKPRPVMEETSAHTEPIPMWKMQDGKRWAKVTKGEWEEVLAKRRRAVTKGATLVSLQFLADQVITTSNSIASFAGMATRLIWLRKARRRQGEE